MHIDDSHFNPNTIRLCQPVDGVREGSSCAWPCRGAWPGNWEMGSAGIACWLVWFSR